MTQHPDGPRLGVVLLESAHAVDTIDSPNPFNPSAPQGVPSISMAHPDFWSVPTAFAVAANATSEALVERNPRAIAGVGAAVDRLAGHCDLIVGNCGYMYAAMPSIHSNTPALLSGLQLLPAALGSTDGAVGIVTFSRNYTERLLADHTERARLRIVGLDHLPAWSALENPKNTGTGRVDVERLRSELLEMCLDERRTGALTDIRALVLQCTYTPVFRAELAAALAMPIWDIAGIAHALLGRQSGKPFPAQL